MLALVAALGSKAVMAKPKRLEKRGQKTALDRE
jgi:hypothetical protein